MSLQTKLTTHRAGIESALELLITDLEHEFGSLAYGKDAVQKLRGFLFGGKMIRGSLICLTYQLFSKQTEVPDYVYQTAAAEEIFASALLIHDDVMDRDRIRRGKPSVFAQYEQEALAYHVAEAEHYSYSQAINLGDICFFWVQRIVTQLSVSADIRLQLQNILARESIFTGLGQMLDVNAGMFRQELTQTEIESISLNKTARYTFVLPFLLGATLAEVDQKTLNILTDLGKNLGTLFQIKDDELGLFGSEQDTGKPEGNDVKEGKQTLFAFFARKLLDQSNLETFNKLYGSFVTSHQLTNVRDMVINSGAVDEVRALMFEYRERSVELIGLLDISDTDKQEMIEFVEFNMMRKK